MRIQTRKLIERYQPIKHGDFNSQTWELHNPKERTLNFTRMGISRSQKRAIWWCNKNVSWPAKIWIWGFINPMTVIFGSNQFTENKFLGASFSHRLVRMSPALTWLGRHWWRFSPAGWWVNRWSIVAKTMCSSIVASLMYLRSDLMDRFLWAKRNPGMVVWESAESWNGRLGEFGNVLAHLDKRTSVNHWFCGYIMLNLHFDWSIPHVICSLVTPALIIYIYTYIYIYCLIVGYIYSTIREYKIYIHSFLFEYVHFGLLNHRPHSCIICSPWVGLSSLPHVVCPTSCRSADAWKTSGDPSGTGWGPQKSVQLLHGALTMLHGRFMEVPQ